MDSQNWREKLSQLDLVRECSATTSDCCWLCDDLESWNTVLNAHQLDLIEWRVGKLQLSLLPKHNSDDVEDWHMPCSPYSFMVWLPKKHSCVDAISITEGHPYFHITEFHDRVSKYASNLHYISIIGTTSYNWALLLDALSPIEQLEDIVLRDITVCDDSSASKLAHILSENSASIRRVDLSQAKIYCSAADILMSGISKCERLEDLMFSANLNPTGLRHLTRLLRSTKTLKTLQLKEQCENDDFTMESDPEENNEEIWRAIGDLIRENSSLTFLHYLAYNNGCTKFLSALETNSVLKSLTISGYICDYMHIGPHVGALLKSMLSKNKGLRSLTLEACYIDDGAAELIFQGLHQNTTLEFLDVSHSCVRLQVQDLLSALRLNKTLRLLKIDAREASTSERKALSVELARNHWYGRVHIPLSDADVEELGASIPDPLLCCTELQLNGGLLSETSFSALCSLLASNTCVKDLTIYFHFATSAHVSSLYEMLQENSSLRSLTFHDGHTEPGLSVIASQGLLMNEFVTDLTIVCFEMSTMSAELLGLLLETNESLHKLALTCLSGLEPQCLDAIAEGLMKNYFITQAGVVGCTNLSIRTAVKRNVLCLHRAARFVLRQNVKKPCAEAFELLESKASLISCLKKNSGMTEAEAKSAVEAARKFICSNYLLINRIVAHKVECYAGEGTQIDSLNFECWLAITKYLKVSDVVYA